NYFTVVGVPDFPEPRESERLTTGHANVPRLLLAVHRRPLVEALRGDEAAPLLKGVAEGGLVGHGIGAGVEAADADLGIFGPARNQAPPEQHAFTLVLTLADRQDGLRGCHVEAGVKE